MTEEMPDYRAIHNHVIYSAKSFGWMIVGHSNHHLKAIEDKYLA